MPRDIRDGFSDDVRDFAQDSARNLEVGALLGPGETAMYRTQHGLGVAAGFFQCPDTVLQGTDAIGKSDGAVDRPTGGLLEDLQVVWFRLSLRDSASNLDQQRAERLANLIVQVARKSLAFHRELALAPTVAHSLILQSPRYLHDVRDPAGDELQDGDALGCQHLTSGLPLL